MTQAAPAPSKAARFADDAEALGWEVERERLPEGGRAVFAIRGDECYHLVWHRNSHGNLVFAYGEHWQHIGTDPAEAPAEIHNVKAALRDMAMRRSANGALLPFDPAADDEKTILSVLGGKTIEWRNSITGATEEGDLPRGGMHFKITDGPKGRTLHFPDRVHTGFRSVYLNSITKVK